MTALGRVASVGWLTSLILIASASLFPPLLRNEGSGEERWSGTRGNLFQLEMVYYRHQPSRLLESGEWTVESWTGRSTSIDGGRLLAETLFLAALGLVCLQVGKWSAKNASS